MKIKREECEPFNVSVSLQLLTSGSESAGKRECRPCWLPMFIAVYNLFYTSMPVLALGIFDQDVSDLNSLNYPKLYVAGQRNLLFNKVEFIKSALHGFFTSCVIFLIPYG